MSDNGTYYIAKSKFYNTLTFIFAYQRDNVWYAKTIGDAKEYELAEFTIFHVAQPEAIRDILLERNRLKTALHEVNILLDGITSQVLIIKDKTKKT